jgi:hypothetical protein
VSVLVRPEVRLVKQFERDFGISIREVILREGQMLEVGEEASFQAASSEG